MRTGRGESQLGIGTGGDSLLELDGGHLGLLVDDDLGLGLNDGALGVDLSSVDVDLIGVKGDEVGVLVDLEAVYTCQQRLRSSILLGACLLDGNRSIIFESLEIWLKSQVIMHRLDIGRQDLAALDIG
jgi:hypothetical protein